MVVILNEGFDIISIANGTKSIGRKDMTDKGNILHDCHAETLARRAFKRFIIDNIDNPRYFVKNDEDKYVKTFKVLFYTS